MTITSLYRITRGDWDGVDAALAEGLALFRGLGQARWTMEAASSEERFG